MYVINVWMVLYAPSAVKLIEGITLFNAWIDAEMKFTTRTYFFTEAGGLENHKNEIIAQIFGRLPTCEESLRFSSYRKLFIALVFIPKNIIIIMIIVEIIISPKIAINWETKWKNLHHTINCLGKV